MVDKPKELYEEKAKEARLAVLKMVHKAQTSHIASNFSIIDIATVLYENLQKGDEVVWSKGWVAASIYYFLYKQGILTEEQLNIFPNPPFFGLAETTIPGVHVSAGSMGHGLPVAVGMALGKKLAGESGRVFCIMSDGELNEGTTWESAMVASHHKLDNLTVVIDKNDWQAMGKTSEILDLKDVVAKFRSFGFHALEGDGHDYKRIEKILYQDLVTVGDELDTSEPKCFVANTIKGKGVSFMENALTFHYLHVTDEVYEKAVKELA